MLEHQPQKSEVAKRGAAVVYGLRGLLDDGRERLQGGRAKISSLRERVPDSPPGPSEGGGRSSSGGSRFGTIGGGRNGSRNGGGGNGRPPRLPTRISSRRPRKPKPGRVKKLRLAIILVGLGALAMVSTFFGMMMAVSGDLPELETKEQYAQAQNSEVFDSQGRKMGTLLSNTGRILVESEDINPYMKSAVVAIEDERFYEHNGVDFQGMFRAAYQDLVPGGSIQGASTITQQFVKNALEAQNSRTVFQKFRESALAYHLERQWDKDKILTQYLNTIYFGEGAYGIEAAARTYFGDAHPECMAEGADPCASLLQPHEAALLAGIITSPSAFSPRANPIDATERRNIVLQKMVEQDSITAGAVRRCDPDHRSPRPRTSSAPRPTRSRPTSPSGCASSSSTSTAPAAPSAAGSTSGPRSTSTCRTRPRAPRTTRSRASSRPRPWSSSTTTPAASRRWSAATTSRRSRSTSPPTATGSRARRSSPSR